MTETSPSISASNPDNRQFYAGPWAVDDRYDLDAGFVRNNGDTLAAELDATYGRGNWTYSDFDANNARAKVQILVSPDVGSDVAARYKSVSRATRNSHLAKTQLHALALEEAQLARIAHAHQHDKAA